MKKTPRWTILAIALSTQFISLAAFGDAAVAPELTLSELEQSTLNFEATLQGANPGNKAILTGMVFDDCKAGLTISQTVSATAASFRFNDPSGSFRSCMAAHKANNHSCTATTCTRLSQLPNASMELARAGDVSVQICHEDLNRDLNREQCEDFSQPIAHISAATIARQRLEARQAARQRRIDSAWQKVRGCRHDSDELVLARAGRDSLASLGELTDQERGRIDRELDAVELRLLKRRAERASIEDLELVREELLALADRRSEGRDEDSCDDLAPIYHQVAVRYAHMRDSNNARNDSGTLNEGYGLASATIGEAQELSCMSDRVKHSFAGYQRDMEIDRVTALAAQGSQGNQELYHSVWNLTARLQADYVSACYSYNPSQDACTSAYNAMGSLQQIQQRSADADRLKAESLQARQQMMAQFTQSTQAQGPNGGALNPQLQPPGLIGGFAGSANSSGGYRFQ